MAHNGTNVGVTNDFTVGCNHHILDCGIGAGVAKQTYVLRRTLCGRLIVGIGSNSAELHVVNCIALTVVSATKHNLGVVDIANSGEIGSVFEVNVIGLCKEVALEVLTVGCDTLVECSEVIDILNQIWVSFRTRTEETRRIDCFESTHLVRHTRWSECHNHLG